VNVRLYNVLFLCTGNSARSIIAESLLNTMGQGRFKGFSAGSHPGGAVNPLVLAHLNALHVSTEGARSKSWDEFKDQHLDFIITICDEVKETAPVWPSQPIVAHWHSPDPLRFAGTPEQVRHFFFKVATQIAHRIDLFCSLPDPKLDALEVQLIGEKCNI